MMMKLQLPSNPPQSLQNMDLATRSPFPFFSLSILVTSAKKIKTTASHARIPPKPTSHPLPSCGRRELLILSGITSTAPNSLAIARADEAVPDSSREAAVNAADTTITDRVFLDITICPTAFKPERSTSEVSAVCSDGEPLGRIVIGLYGKQVPRTVANFKAMCTKSAGSSYEGTLIHKVLPGQYFLAGRQGRREKGEVLPPHGLERNGESVDPRAFRLRHTKPGTVSLSLSENDDDDEFKLSPDYRNVEFLVTTGPGPCPQLDNNNIVFGTVLEGMDVVTAIAAVPTYKPGERIRQLNDLAEFLGDERAQNARNLWNRPLKNLFISSCGELKVAKPSLAPILP
eukprot:Gb_21620 [translate_table: standard]